MAAITEVPAPTPRLTRWLERAHPATFSAYAIIAAFSTYFSMYAFRKPFTAATFDHLVHLPFGVVVHYKIFLIISQVIGYMLSKFIGIKVVSEMDGRRRALAIVVAIGVAETALVLFAVTPRRYNAVFMFLNGLPLGMVWGLIFGYLEGRRVSEVLGAGLSASYILASGVVKTIGRWSIDVVGVPETWMPAFVGLLFLPLLFGMVYLLSRLPPPTAADEAARVRRVPMDARQRTAFLTRLAPGLVALTLLYMFLTAFRSIRDDFAVEIWAQLDPTASADVYAWTEVPVTIGVLVALGLLMLIRSNRRALLVIHLVMAFGAALIGLAALGYHLGLLGPVAFMVLGGLGGYIAYVPFGCVLFDRLIAAVGLAATAGFMIYVTDAFGYLGSVALMLYKNFGEADLNWLQFFVRFSLATSILCTASFLFSALYFARKTRAAPGGSP